MGTMDEVLKLLRETPMTVSNLSDAYGLVLGMGLRSPDIEMAIMFMNQGETETALSYIYGPTNRGSGKGAIADIEKMNQSR